MHFNENSARDQASTNGKPRYEVYFPKCKKGDPSVKVVKTSVTFGNKYLQFSASIFLLQSMQLSPD